VIYKFRTIIVFCFNKYFFIMHLSKYKNIRSVEVITNLNAQVSTYVPECFYEL